MRADRLLSIIWLLRAHQKLSTAELAERLEVSRRTIMRDIDALSAAGVPVYCERGCQGGVGLLPGYRTDVTGLSNDESRALFAGVTTWGAESLGLGDALASGLRKLLAAVPDDYRQDTSEASARIVIDPQGWLPQPERERTGELFQTVQDAVFSQHRLRIVYRQKTRASTTVALVEPHGLISAGRSWYLCSSRDSEIVFIKLSRIDEAAILPTPCDVTRKVDVAKEWKRERARFLDRFTPVVATVWVRETRWSDVHEWVIRAAEKPPNGLSPGEGWAFMELEFVDDLHAMTIMLRLGPDARIQSPKVLRQEFVDYLTDTAALYTADDSGENGDRSRSP